MIVDNQWPRSWTPATFDHHIYEKWVSTFALRVRANGFNQVSLGAPA